MKGELAVMKGTLERFVELAAKDATEHLDGKKEVVAWFDPAGVIDRQATSRHHAMYMQVKFEFLTPGMQHVRVNRALRLTGQLQMLREDVAFCVGAR